jgi:transketolase
MEQTEPKDLTGEELDQLAINTIRTLSIDAVQQAQSGHPGTPMALAPLVYTLWNNVLRFDPKDPIWPNRDRFVLSNGHASMLLWSVLFLTETRAVNADYERLGQPSVTLDDIRHFRQLASKAPGHPEYHWVSGVETTTGPLGQGVATSVGMAIARKWLGSRYNKPGFEIFDYDVYAICGDGCLMEGISSEAASLAGHLQLDDLCWIYDNNHITIEGNTSIAFTEDVAARFLAYRWNVLRVGDANDLQRIQDALAIFRKTRDRPTLIILDSHIGYGSPHKSIAPKLTASLWERTRFASPSAPITGRRTPNSSCPTASRSASRAGSARVGTKRGANGRRSLTVIVRDSRSSPLRSLRCSGATCRPAGIATCLTFHPMPKASLGATHRVKC